MSATADDIYIPKGAIVAAASLVLLSLALVSFGRWSGIGVVRGNAVVAVQSISYRFDDRSDGGVAVVSPDGARVVAVVAPGSDGFIRTVLRSLAYDRKRYNVGSAPPFNVTQWSDGRWTLDDPSTGRSIGLAAFGIENMKLFANLADRQGAGK